MRYEVVVWMEYPAIADQLITEKCAKYSYPKIQLDSVRILDELVTQSMLMADRKQIKPNSQRWIRDFYSRSPI